MPITVAFFNCPHCVDSFAFDFQKLKSLTRHSRVRVRCPDCQNVVEVVTNAYSVIHGADPEKYQWGEILEILKPDLKTSEEAIRRNIRLHYDIIGVHSRVDCDVHRGKATTKKFCILEVRYTSCETDETRTALGRGRKGSVRHKYVSPCSATVKGKRRIAKQSNVEYRPAFQLFMAVVRGTVGTLPS